MSLSRQNAEKITKCFLCNYPAGLRPAYVFREDTRTLYGDRSNDVPDGMKGGFNPIWFWHNGVLYQGQVHVPLKNIIDADDMFVTLRHEVLGHYGINTFTPPEKRALLDALMAWRAEPGLRSLWDHVNMHYAEAAADIRAEEVWAFYCGSLLPEHHARQDIRRLGAHAFIETCVARMRPMRISDLHHIACMVAEGLHDCSRRQQSFPALNRAFRQANEISPSNPIHALMAEEHQDHDDPRPS